MKIFVSHSIKDKRYLESLEKMISNTGIKLLIAEHLIDMKNSISEKIRNMIEHCDIGLILMTEKGFNSGFVREEIGYMDALKKPVILVFEEGYEKKYGGFKYGHDYIPINKNKPEVGLVKVKNILLNHYEKLSENRKIQNGILIGIGIIVGGLLLSSSD